MDKRSVSLDGERVKALRGKRHITQNDLAEALDVTLRTIGRVENNATRIRNKNAARLADFLHVTLEDLEATSHDFTGMDDDAAFKRVLELLRGVLKTAGREKISISNENTLAALVEFTAGVAVILDGERGLQGIIQRMEELIEMLRDGTHPFANHRPLWQEEPEITCLNQITSVETS